jgi:hypothetical protein
VENNEAQTFSVNGHSLNGLTTSMVSNITYAPYLTGIDLQCLIVSGDMWFFP